MKRKTRSLLLLLFLPLLPLVVQCDWFDDDDHRHAGSGPFVLSVDTQAGAFTLFRINPDNGALTEQGAIRPGGLSYPTMALLHPDGKLLFVVNSDAPGDGWNEGGSVAAFRYSPSGTLTEVAGSPFTYDVDGTPAINTPINGAVTPDGKFLYVADVGRGAIHIFSIDAATGTLTATTASPVPAGDPHGIAMHPTGKFLFDGSQGGTVRAWAIDPATGALAAAPNSPYDSTGYNVWITASADGRHVYSMGNGSVTTFSVNPDTGELTRIQELSPERGEKGSAASPDGRFLATANFNADSVSIYAVDGETGQLAELEGSPYPAGDQPKNVAFSADGKFLYAANFRDSTVSAFSVDAGTGALTEVGSYGTGEGPKFLMVLP